MSLILFIACSINNARKFKSFFTFTTGATHTAVYVTTFVATPRFGVINAERFAFASNVGLGNASIRSYEFNVVARTLAHGSIESVNKRFSAIGVNSVVTKVVCHHYFFQMLTFGQTSSHRKHNAIAEWHHGRKHVLFVVITV